MARLFVNSQLASDTVTAVQFMLSNGLSSGSQIVCMTVKSRASNTGNLYLGTSSAVTSSSGWQVIAGAREDWNYEGLSTRPRTVSSSAMWVKFDTASDVMDFAAVVDI